jgi:hypothetical protein
MKNENKIIIPDEIIMNKIYFIRGLKVMLDNDLAELYSVETKRLNEQVKRNIARFPEDFMFQLNQEEFKNLKSHFETSRWGGRRKLPYAFTEHGILMLSSVLNSTKAIDVSIQIMRIFVRIRQFLIMNKDILERLEKVELKLIGHDDQIMFIFEYIKQLELSKQQQDEQASRKKIGFRKEE